MKFNGKHILVVLAFLGIENTFADYNQVILQGIKEMPRGGEYATSKLAHTNLKKALEITDDGVLFNPHFAQPSYCSGATYLVLLHVLTLDNIFPYHVNWKQFIPQGRDGYGIWGRWNANGPGTARLFFETGAGYNFTSVNHAKAGDFLKIFWTDHVGKKERGHSVIYLKHDKEGITYWSSNQPNGYGLKKAPWDSISHLIFSRLINASRLLTPIPEKDEYLASLLSTESSFKEALEKSGIQTHSLE